LEEAVDTVHDGVSAKEVDEVARKVIEKAGYGKYFTHSTGHGLGLEVHEKPRLSASDDTILKKNMVVTVEPGIYIAGLGGVRIEEDIVVRIGGCEVLTKNPNELLII
jgi:Xaa-Pro aminopeptidase